ncbi:MAG: endonuclease III domain-containing protein [Syntrophobacteraceae bacterium]
MVSGCLREPLERADQILSLLINEYGTEPWNWHTRQAPFQVLISTVLSHRTRDENTDKAAQALFARYPDPESVAGAPLDEIEALIRPANYYRTKAQRVKQICRILLDRYAGETPENIDDLLKLPGVGRKTANCVMVYGFKKPSIPVDTHVHRITNRLGLVRTRKPEETERELLKIVPEKYLLYVNELLVKHGRRICKPIGPFCDSCSIKEHCGNHNAVQQ